MIRGVTKQIAVGATVGVMGLTHAAMVIAQSEPVRETISEKTYWRPANYSTTGDAIDVLFDFILGLTMFTLVAVMAVLIYFLVRYRYQPGRVAKFIHGNNRLELAWTLVPTVIIAMIAVFSQAVWSEIKYPDQMPSGEGVVEIDVIGQQFQWNFHYPGADGEFGERRAELVNPSGNPEEQIGLDRSGAGADDFVIQGYQVIPVNQRVRSLLTSRDVIHSYFLPDFRIKQDTVPGLNSPMWFEATQVSSRVVGVGGPEDFSEELGRLAMNIEFFGDAEKHASLIRQLRAVPNGQGKPFEIVCAELCGQGHFTMRGRLYVVPQELYELFVAAKIAEAEPLDEGDDDDYGY